MRWERRGDRMKGAKRGEYQGEDFEEKRKTGIHLLNISRNAWDSCQSHGRGEEAIGLAFRKRIGGGRRLSS